MAQPGLSNDELDAEINRRALIYKQNQQYRQTQEIDRWRNTLDSPTTNNDESTTTEEEESLLVDHHDQEEDMYDRQNSSTDTPPNRVLRWALSSTTESFFSDSLAISTLFLGTAVILLHLRLSDPAQQIPWIIIVSPIFLSAGLCILGSLQVLVRECGKSSLLSRRLPRSTVVDHVNHICFWLAFAGSAGLWTISVSRPSTSTPFPALFIAMPVLVAMLVQASLYCAKNRHYACGFQVPEGFPVDPLHLTALFVAARIDQLIMWDWSIVLWCPWCVWLLAVYNSIVYAIVTGDVMVVHGREAHLPIQEQSYAMPLGANRYVRPRWLGYRNGARFMMSLVTSIGLFVVLHYGALRLNGNVEIALGYITIPTTTMFLVCGVSMLFISCIVTQRLVQNEPHRCAYCSAPISMMLQIDRQTYQREDIERMDVTVGVLRYENPEDNLERDVDINDMNNTAVNNIDTVVPEVPVELIRRAGQAMWGPYRRGKGNSSSSSSSSKNTLPGETKSKGGGGGGGSGGGGGNNASNSMKCTICREKIADCVFLPCGHNTQCWDCARRVIRAQNRHRFNRNAVEGGDAI
jgi:uncharacterized membrane protein YgcG